jgi:hypothetical protein
MLQQSGCVIRAYREVIGDDGGRCSTALQQGAIDALLDITDTQQPQWTYIDIAI